jgi:hypothetical protein
MLQLADRSFGAHLELEIRFTHALWARYSFPKVAYKQPSAERTRQRYWDRVAEQPNEMVDCNAWSGAPWTGDQWAVLIGVAHMSRPMTSETL